MYRQSVLARALPLAIVTAIGTALTSCVSYQADRANAATVAAEVREREGGAFTYAEAKALAFRQNPELRALAARARAAGADLTPFELQGEYRSGRKMLSLMVDPIALLDLGPRGAANRTLDAVAAAAAAELVTRRWQVAADIAEVFVVEAVLAELTVPAIDIDPDGYERAGLASPVDAARVRAARASATAERATLHAERERNLARCRRLLGLAAKSAVTLQAGTFDTVPVRTEDAILARPDLTLAAAQFRVADAEFRAAVADQYPSLMIGPEIPLDGSPLEWMAILRLPIGGWGKANAAQQRREAARAELETAYLAASQQVHEAELAVADTAATARAAQQSLLASTGMLAAARTALEVDIDAFARLAEAAGMAIRDARERRMAKLASRVAELRFDVAHGWPTVVQAPIVQAPVVQAQTEAKP